LRTLTAFCAAGRATIGNYALAVAQRVPDTAVRQTRGRHLPADGLDRHRRLPHQPVNVLDGLDALVPTDATDIRGTGGFGGR
jgi:hypothetical protein